MKMKSFAILAVSCLVGASSLTYMVTALADDNQFTSTPSTPSYSDPHSNAAASPADSSSPTDMNDNSDASDEATPDTATGDDDY